MSLNNYNKSYSNILFWLENPGEIIRIKKIEEGKLIKFWDKGSDKINPGWCFKIEDYSSNLTIEELMKKEIGVENIPFFLKYFNRYVRPWYKKWCSEANPPETVYFYSEVMDLFPVEIDFFITLSNISNANYNIDKIVEDALDRKEINFEDYKIKKSDLDLDILKEIVSLFPGKVDEYKKGKTNLINMFLGEYLKRLKDKNVDKAMLLTGIKNFIEQC